MTPSKGEPAVAITGGSRGIGLALGVAYAKRGHRVVLVARDAEQLEKAAAEILRATGVRPQTLALDVTARDADQRLLASVGEEGSFIDILINNAGVGLSGPFAEKSADDLSRLIDVNITAVTRLTRAVLPEMTARRRGTIVMMSSLGGAVPGPYQAAYYASKSYVLSLSEALAAECSGTGVRVSCVVPGPVETQFHAAMNSDSALYRRLLPQMSEQKLARLIVRHVALGRRVIAPGVLATAGYGALRILPHTFLVPLMALLLRNRSE